MSTLFDAAEEAGTFVPDPREPYRVPSLAEVHAQAGTNGLTAVGSFSGCGGSSTGLKMAGWDVPVVVEFIPEAARTYAANYPGTTVFERDIRELTGAELLEAAGLRVGELDLYEGSPPCSSFSAAGSGQKDWGKVKSYSDAAQRTDDLFFEYVRLVGEMRPRAFLAENVPGLIRGEAVGEYAHRITGLMSDLGYRVAARLLNAASFGAATRRERLIFIGLREDLGVYPTFPEASVDRPYSIREALAVVPTDDPEDVAGSSMEGKAVGRTWQAWQDARRAGLAEPDTRMLPCERCGELPTDHLVLVVRDDAEVFVRVIDMMAGERSPWVGSEGAINKGLCEDGERAKFTKTYFLLVVPDPDLPCPTITATGSQTGAASVTHPWLCRKMTPLEALVVSGFPADYVLTGTREQRYERVGRAVPPPLYRAVSAHLEGLLS